jgi:hypothetical protein
VEGNVFLFYEVTVTGSHFHVWLHGLNERKGLSESLFRDIGMKKDIEEAHAKVVPIEQHFGILGEAKLQGTFQILQTIELLCRRSGELNNNLILVIAHPGIIPNGPNRRQAKGRSHWPRPSSSQYHPRDAGER